jgi:hypothetical protein
VHSAPASPAPQVASLATNSDGPSRTRSSIDALSLEDGTRDSPLAGTRSSLGGSVGRLHSAHSVGSGDTEALAELLYSSDPMRGASC